MKRICKLRRRADHRRGQAMTETIILVALCALVLAAIIMALPRAISTHYEESQKVLASPL